MNLALPCLMITLLTGIGDPPRLFAANDDPPVVSKDKPKHKLTVAILDFEATTPANLDLGKQIAEALAATLGGNDSFELVDRASMKDTLAENALSMTGLVDSSKANKIGKVVGAKILITGKVFPLDKQMFFTAKLIGTETTLVEGILVKGEKEADMGELLMKLSDKIATRLRDSGARLVAQDDAIEEPLPGLKKALAGRKLPIVGVHIRETHTTTAPSLRIDPAVETELQLLLKNAGFTVIDGEDHYADAGVTLVITGEAFSEFSGRITTLISCAARAEIKITDRKTGELIFTTRATTRGVDLAENAASKTALQKAGHVIGIEILRHFAENQKK